MFAKKPPPAEPKLPGLPSVLHVSGPGQLGTITQEAPNDRLAQMIIAQAFREGATEITLTPDGKGLVVHYRVAGEWRETMSIPLHVAPGLGAAFKTLAGLPVWEHRMALQGLIVVQYGADDYDVHIAITPTRHGEKIVLRMERV